MRQGHLPLGLYWRGDVIWMRCQRKENRFNESTGTCSVKDAAAAYTARMGRERSPKTGRVILSAFTMRNWDTQRAVQEQRSDGTLMGIEYGWKHLAEHIEDFGRLKYDNLHRYVLARRGEGAGNNTIRKELCLLKRGLARASDEGLDVKVPMRWPRLSVTQKKESQAGREVTLLELHAFLRQLRPQACASALCALFTGARGDELMRLTPAMLRRVSHIEGLAAVVEMPASITKTRQKRRIGLTELGVQVYTAAVPISRLHRTAFKAASARAGVTPYIHYRTMRHTFATVAGQCGDPMGVQVVMGHSRTISLTYQHRTDQRLATVAQAIDTGLAIPEDVLACLASLT